MKIKSREINVFSMSALDFFAIALGAIILVMIIVFPYYLNISQVEPSDLYDRLKEVEQQNEELERQENELKKQGKYMKPLVMARHTGKFEISNVHRMA